jgi:hypothetical protein
MKSIPGLENLDVNWQEATPELQWKVQRDKALQMGLSFLADSGWMEERFRAGQLYAGKDPVTGQPMWKEPETAAEKAQAREAF